MTRFFEAFLVASRHGRSFVAMLRRTAGWRRQGSTRERRLDGIVVDGTRLARAASRSATCDRNGRGEQAYVGAVSRRGDDRHRTHAPTR